MIKQYQYLYQATGAATFIIDTDIFTNEDAVLALSFFTIEQDEELTALDQYIKELALAVIKYATYNDYNLAGVLKNYNKEVEGYANIDGACGILLTHIEAFEFDSEDFADINIKEVIYKKL